VSVTAVDNPPVLKVLGEWSLETREGGRWEEFVPRGPEKISVTILDYNTIGEYVVPGAEALDTEEGDISVRIQKTGPAVLKVNPSGDFDNPSVVLYSVSDSAGNTVSAVHLIFVEDTCVDAPPTSDQSVDSSQTAWKTLASLDQSPALLVRCCDGTCSRNGVCLHAVWCSLATYYQEATPIPTSIPSQTADAALGPPTVVLVGPVVVEVPLGKPSWPRLARGPDEWEVGNLPSARAWDAEGIDLTDQVRRDRILRIRISGHLTYQEFRLSYVS
jgi:hypothetical protein